MSNRLRVVLRALVVGTAFGFVLVRSEAVSWFRITEMFRFQSFHMYGIIGSAVLVGLVSLQLIRRLSLRDAEGQPLHVPPKESSGWNTRYWAGGTVFGLGWGILGACPGPIFALIGAGESVLLVAFVAAIAGTWTYGALRSWLPHH